MTDYSGLDRLLLIQGQDDWEARMAGVREAVRQASWFEDGSAEDLQLTRIIQAVRDRGDQALAQYSRSLDQVELTQDRIRVERERLAEAHRCTDPGVMAAVRGAIENVRRYQSAVLAIHKAEHPGIRFVPLDRVGVCVPGASAPLASTVVMTAVPAQVAGVRQVAVVCPPRHKGDIHPLTLAVCHELGIEEVYRVGGAQAVAALAYGTKSIPRVDKIVGPGNRWVQMAKRKVFGQVAIDSIAGPSEVVVIANAEADPAWVAADMLSQAEHAPGVAILLTDSKDLAAGVIDQLRVQLPSLGRADQTRQCLLQYGAVVVFVDLDQAIAAAQAFAPEHLQVQCGRLSKEVAGRLTNAGAIFVGPYSPVAVGDYWAGPSHTLPTGQTARFFSPLSSNDFVRSVSLIEYDKAQLEQAAQQIVTLALVEGLDAHARSVQIRR